MKITSANVRGGYLYREPLPKSIHGFAPRKAVKASTWKKISTAVRAETDFCCCMCGKDCSQKKGTLHTHEVYEFDTDKKLATIVDLIPICIKCHNVIHFQGSMKRGVDRQVLYADQKLANQGKTPDLDESEVESRWIEIGAIDFIDPTYFRRYIPTLPNQLIKVGEQYESFS